MKYIFIPIGLVLAAICVWESLFYLAIAPAGLVIFWMFYKNKKNETQ